MNDTNDVITIEPNKRSGKPCIRGLRITVYDVLEYLAGGMIGNYSRFPRIDTGRYSGVFSLCGRT